MCILSAKWMLLMKHEDRYVCLQQFSLHIYIAWVRYVYASEAEQVN